MLLGQKWMGALACDWPQYKELALEFHSTFMYDDSEFESEDVVSFSLGRFSSCLRNASKKNMEFCLSDVDLREFWGTIADSPFSTSMVESEIRDPVLRYMHRVLACTVVLRFVVEPQVMPPHGSAAIDVMRDSIPTHRQRPVFRRDMPPRQYQLREPIPDLLTLEFLCDRMGGYHDQHRYWYLTGQRRQEDAMRYLMTSLHIYIPEYYRALDQHDERGGDDAED
ncbi:hypothetical protein R6Q59_019718 [Mikania micrantha]